MKKTVFQIFLVVVLSINSTNGQNPNWAVDENAFEQTMVLTTFLSVNNNRLSSPNDQVAAFVGDEIRGVANLNIPVNDEGTFVASMIIFANSNGEALTFKIYDSVNNQVVDVPQTLNFQIDANIGSRFQAFSLSDVALNNEADIIDFAFEGVTIKSIQITGDEVILEIDEGIDETQLTPLFELSTGAQLFLGTSLQTTGTSGIDFTNPIQYQVRSEDQSVLKPWSVSVIKTPEEVGAFFKKNSVCYIGGQIKVEYSIEGTNVILEADTIGNSVNQTIQSGEAIFTDLPAGIYQVMVGNLSKEIQILQD